MKKAVIVALVAAVIALSAAVVALSFVASRSGSRPNASSASAAAPSATASSQSVWTPLLRSQLLALIRQVDVSDAIAQCAASLIEKSFTADQFLKLSSKKAGLAVTAAILKCYPSQASPSAGGEGILLQDYRGESWSSVSAALVKLGFRLSQHLVYSDTVPQDDVVSTDPAAGTRAPRGARIIVFVSRGPFEFPMPSVVGMRELDAEHLLRLHGLWFDAIQIPGSTGSTVKGQLPAAGTIVHQGETVKIYIG